MTSSELITVGGLVDAIEVTFAIYADDLDPAAITQRLAVTPTSSQRRGDPHPHGHRSPPRRTGAWFLSAEGKKTDPARVIDDLLRQLPDGPALWEALARDHDIQLRLGIFLEGWNRGFVLPPAVLNRIAHFHAALSVDIYGA